MGHTIRHTTVSISRAFAPLSAYLKLQISRTRDSQDLVSRIVQLVGTSIPHQAHSEYATQSACCLLFDDGALRGNTRLALCYRAIAAYDLDFAAPFPPLATHENRCPWKDQS
jgi:hypothetical protein